MRRANSKMKRKILLVMLLGIGLVFSQGKGVFALYEERPKEEKPLEELRGILPQKPQPRAKHQAKQPEYAPGQLIIKYKPEVGAQAGKLFKEGRPFKSFTGTDTLDELNKKHKVKKIERVFKDLEAKGKVKGRDFITAQEDSEETKKKFPQRAKRAPKDAKIPDLENIYLLELEDPKADIPAIAQEYKQDPSVVYAEPNYKVKVQMYPNDPYYSSSNSWGQGYDDLWGLKKIQCQQAWDISQGEGVVVAVIDTGIDYNHEDLAPNIWINQDEILGNGIDDDNNGYIDDIKGYDFANNDNDPMDGMGHGTHVAGTIAAVGNNNKGVIGVAPRAKVMAVKGLDDSGYGDDDKLASCLRYAANNGADVINNSWGGEGSSLLIKDAVNYAYSQGCVVVAAAGNDNDDASYYTPAGIANVIAVAAFDQNDARCYFSNYGTKIDVAAPGGNGSSDPYNILSTMGDNTYIASAKPNLKVNIGYWRLAGTSMACPHVSGLAALMLKNKPDFTNEDIRNELVISADDVGDVGRDRDSGFGRINALKALLTNKGVLIYSTSYQTNDIVTGNGDGFLNPGEDIVLSVSVKNAWLPASNVIINLISNNSLVVVTQGVLPLGLMAHGEIKEAFFQFKVSSSALELQPIQLQLHITADGGFDFKETLELGEVILESPNPSPPFQSGWPISVDLSSYGAPSEMVVGDINNDGRQEVVFHDQGFLSVYDNMGNLLPGWPQEFDGYLGFHPLLADIDQDNDLEIFVGFNGFHHNGAKINGWPKKASDQDLFPIHIVAIADLNKDGKPEIIGVNTSGYVARTSGGKIFIWDGQGNLLPNMPINAPVLYNGDTDYLKDVALGDLDGDGDLEIIVMGQWSSYEYYYNNIGHIYAWHHTGEPVAGWPQTIQPGGKFLCHTPSVGDIDGDGKDEIIVTIYNWTYRYGRVYVWKGTGILVNGWPKDITSDSPNITFPTSSLGDIDKDGKLEIIVTQNEHGIGDKLRVYIFKEDGAILPGWPQEISDYFNYGNTFTGDLYQPRWNQPIITDISGDSKPEILIPLIRYLPFLNCGLLRIYAWNFDGSPVIGFPFGSIRSGVVTSLSALDLDRDGDLELGIVKSSGDEHKKEDEIYFWDLESRTDSNINEWPCYAHDFQRTYRYRRNDITPPVTPVVSDEGQTTLKKDQLSASWTSEDRETGIMVYQYRITQDSLTGTVVRDWTSTGKNNSVTAGGLNLQSGKTYYFGVKAKNEVGLWSAIGYSDGITVVNQPPQVGTLTPSSGTSAPNQTVTFTSAFTDANGWQDIRYVFFLINNAISEVNCFSAYYNRVTNQLFLQNDAANNYLGGFAPGSNNTIENSYARLNCASTTVSGSGNTLTVTWSVTFKSPFTGTKSMCLIAGDETFYEFTWILKGNWTITNQAPLVGTITPSFGSSAANTAVNFTTTYSDPDTWLNIQYGLFLINSSLNGANCFYGYYDQNSNKLYLRNDANTAWLGGYLPSLSYTIENSYTKLNCASTTVSSSGNTLTVKWNITFKSAFVAALTKNMYLYVKDDANATNGWTQKGTWLVGTNSAPIVGTITPSSGSGKVNTAVSFTTTYSDPDGWQDMHYVCFLVNNGITFTNGLYAVYHPNTDQISLANDSGQFPQLYPRATTGILENSYVKLDCSKTTVEKNGNNLSVNWNITFKSAFVAALTKNMYLYVKDDANATNGWTQKGTWLVGTNSAPIVGTITPSSGSGKVNTAVSFTTTYSDPNGWQDIGTARFIVNTVVSGYTGPYLRYDQNTHKLYLARENDTNESTRWLGGFAPGSANTIENAYVKLNCASTTVSGSGNTLTVKWNITFKSTFTGSKNTYLYVSDDSGASNGWVQKGTWTINP
jgi:subtilisin family serine protease